MGTTKGGGGNAAPHPLVAQVPSGYVSGLVVGRDLEHFAKAPAPFELPEALCRGQQLNGYVSYEWTVNAEATGVTPRRICRRCVGILAREGVVVKIIPE